MEIKPLYFSPDGQIKQAKAGDTLPFPVQAIEIEYVTLQQACAVNTCCIIVDQTAIPINSVSLPLVNYRKLPFIDCIILEAENVGDTVKAAITHGKVYDTTSLINYISNDILYLGSNSLFTTTKPSLVNGDNYSVIVGRMVNQYQFIFDPQEPIDLNAGGGQGGNVPSPAGNPDTWLFTDGNNINWRKIKASDITPDFALTSFSCSTPTLEVGYSVSSFIFNYSSNETSASASISDNFYNLSTVVSTTSPITYNRSFSRNTVGSYSFALTVHNSSNSSSSLSISVTWLIRRYYGSQTKWNRISDLQTFVKALNQTDLASNKNLTYNTNCGTGQNIYYVIPASFGTVSFWVNGFQGGFSKISSINITNQYGITSLYDIYESDNSNLGDTTVNIT